MNPNSGVRMQVGRPNQEDSDGLINPERCVIKFFVIVRVQSIGLTFLTLNLFEYWLKLVELNC